MHRGEQRRELEPHRGEDELVDEDDADRAAEVEGERECVVQHDVFGFAALRRSDDAGTTRSKRLQANFSPISNGIFCAAASR